MNSEEKMKSFFKIYLPILFVVALIVGCGNKFGSPTEIADLKEYKDDATKFSLLYPSNWVTSRVPSKRFAAFSSNEALSRFAKYDIEGFPAAKVDVFIVQVDTLTNLDSIITASMNFKQDIYKREDVTIDGVASRKYTYSFELKDGEFRGAMYVGTKDEKAITFLYFETFADTWSKYEDSFNEIAKSLKLATAPVVSGPEVIFETIEEQAASENLVPKSGPGYTIMISDNFNSTRGTAGGAISSQNYIGKRRADCNIQVDVIDASEQKNLKKIVEENKGNYRNSGALSNITLGGVPAYMFPYQPAAQVKGRAYFAIKGNKLFRITMNWFAGEEADYLPIFEKSVNSIKFD